MKRILKYTLIVLAFLPVLLWFAAEVMLVSLSIAPPQVSQIDISEESIESKNGRRQFGNNWYQQNTSGLWEAYIEGDSYTRGKIFGQLAVEQVESQEEAFISQIRKLIPSEWFLKTLKYGIVFFNRNLSEHVPLEYQKEIYGVSESFSGEYDFVGDKYSRILNYHAAHDVGHALQDLSIVGCSSFAVWNNYTQDSSLIVARNFDFYMGDDFAKDKLILFVKPDSGYSFASVTWAGFMGVVSGMNEHGLTVTLNAAKSEVPNGAKTPISILAREILQYAKSIDEAYKIAESRETFVSESILIGSAYDKAAAIIEKSPAVIDIYYSEDNRLTCSNHYQSEAFKTDEINNQNIEDSDSKYRFERLNQLMEQNFPINPSKSVNILRNQKGMEDAELGMGNPKAINQLLAHHGIVFQPEKRLMWLSTNPFQLGEFFCYDLNQVFESEPQPFQETISLDSLNIDSDKFLQTKAYVDFLRYKELKNRLFEFIALGKDINWNEQLEEEFKASNPESYVTYLILGDFYLESGNKEKASEYYAQSLTKEVASLDEKRKIESNLSQCR